MTVICIAAALLTCATPPAALAPTHPLAGARGGHAVHREWMERGGPAVVVIESNTDIGRRLAAARGWVGEQFVCLQKLWSRESGWDEHGGSLSRAYGIPQSLPGSKMASAGADWVHNPSTQIRWGLGYIAARYGTPCAAWAHSNAHNFY